MTTKELKVEQVELLPCPFCGRPAYVAEGEHLPGLPTFGVAAEHTAACPLRFAMGYVPMHWTELEAAAAWNHRIASEKPSTPVSPSEAKHLPECEHARSPVWLCDCPRTPVSVESGELVSALCATVERVDWRGQHVQELVNPDGPAAADRILQLEAEKAELQQREAEECRKLALKVRDSLQPLMHRVSGANAVVVAITERIDRLTNKDAADVG